MILVNIILVLLIGAILFSLRISSLRRKHIMRMQAAYDQIELYFVKNSSYISNDEKMFLTALKYLVVNPRVLDLRILIAAHFKSQGDKELEKRQKAFNRVLKGMPQEFLELFSDFDYNADRIILFSILAPDNVFYILRLVLKDALKKGLKSIERTRENIKYAMNNNEILGSYALAQ